MLTRGKSGLQTNTIPLKRLFLNKGGPEGLRKVPQKITAVVDGKGENGW